MIMLSGEHDPHLWLDPHNVKALAPALRQAIENVLKARGEYSSEIKTKLDAAESRLLKRVDETDAEWRKTLGKASSRTIVVAHDAYVMLATRYDLTTIAIAGLAARDPTSKDIRRAIEAVKANGAKVVFVYPGPAKDLKAHAKEFSEMKNKEWPKEYLFALDPNYTMVNAYGLRWDAPQETAYPSTFIVDKKGTVQFAKVSRGHGDRSKAADVLKAVKTLPAK